MGMPGIRAGYPLSERQQVALLMQMTAEESVNSPGACLSWVPRLWGFGGRGGDGGAVSLVLSVPATLLLHASLKNRPHCLIRIQLYKITLINFHYCSEMDLCCLSPLFFSGPGWLWGDFWALEVGITFLYGKLCCFVLGCSVQPWGKWK